MKINLGFFGFWGKCVPFSLSLWLHGNHTLIFTSYKQLNHTSSNELILRSNTLYCIMKDLQLLMGVFQIKTSLKS